MTFRAILQEIRKTMLNQPSLGSGTALGGVLVRSWGYLGESWVVVEESWGGLFREIVETLSVDDRLTFSLF